MTPISCSKPAQIPNPYASLISRTHFHVSRKTHHVIVHAKFGKPIDVFSKKKSFFGVLLTNLSPYPFETQEEYLFLFHESQG